MVRGFQVFRESDDENFNATHIEFTCAKESVGSGFFLIPEVYNDFTDPTFGNYYEMQEEEIYITDVNSIVRFRGVILDIYSTTGGLRFDLAESTFFLSQRHCKAEYPFDKGTISDVDAASIQDKEKNFATDEHNNHGVLAYPSPAVIPPDAFTTSRRHRTMLTDVYYPQTADYNDYMGRGFGTKDSLSGTYSVPTEQSVSQQGVLTWSISPADITSQMAVMTKEATSASSADCLRIWCDNSGANNNRALVDVLFDVGEIPHADILGLNIKIQAALRHASTPDARVYIFQYDTTADNGSGTWEDLSLVTSTGVKINVHDPDLLGIFQVWDYTFELSGDTDPNFVNLLQNDWAKYIWSYRERIQNGQSDTKNVIRLCIETISDTSTAGYGIQIGQMVINFVRSGTDTNQYKITGTTPPATLGLATDPSDYLGTGDKYAICPSLLTVIEDMSTAEFGTDDYPFTIVGSGLTTPADKFLSQNFLDQKHLSELASICEYANLTWWFDPTAGTNGVVYIDDEGDEIDSTLTLTEANWPPNSAYLSYPQANILGRVIVRGNKSLGLVFDVSASVPQSSQELIISRPWISNYQEIKTYAESVLAKWENRLPAFKVTLDYESVANIHTLRPGYKFKLTYKNLTNEYIPVNRFSIKWQEGKKPTILLEAGRMGTPPWEKTEKKINAMYDRVSRLESGSIIQDYADNIERRLRTATRGAGADAWSYPDPGGGLGIVAVTDASQDFLVNSVYFNNTEGSNPGFDWEDAFGEGLMVSGAPAFVSEGDIALRDAINAAWIQKNEGALELAIAAELDNTGYDVVTDGVTYDNPSGTDPYVYATDVLGDGALMYDDPAFWNNYNEWVNGTGNVIVDKTTDVAELTYTGDIDNTGYDIYSDIYSLYNPDGPDQTLIASGTAGNEVITVSNDFACLTGTFAATTVKIGEMVLSESGNALEVVTSGAIAKIFCGGVTHGALIQVDGLDTGVKAFQLRSGTFKKWEIMLGDEDPVNHDFKIRNSNDTVLFKIASDTNNLEVFPTMSCNLLMDGSTTDDERLRLPYLSAIPGSVDNGSLWMESDGLHVYYAGTEQLLAPGAPAAHDLDSASHGDVGSVTDAKGSMLWQAVSGTWSRLTPAGTVGHVLACDNVDGTISFQAQPAHNPASHNNTYHSTNYEAANANIQSHVGSPPEDSHHAKVHDMITEHSDSGLTTGHVIVANSPTTFLWAELSHAFLSGIGTNSHINIDSHIAAANPHSTSASDTDLSNHMSDTSTHGVAQVANHAEIGTQIGTHAALATGVHGVGASTVAALTDLHTEAHVLATSGPHTDTLPLTDLIVGTAGSIIIRGAADWEELLKGGASDSDVLTLVSGYPAWQTAGAPGGHTFDSGSHTDVASMTEAEGDTIYRTSGGNWDRLAKGSDNQFLRMAGNVPNWETYSPTIYNYTWSTASSATGSTTFSGASTDQSITYLSVGSTVKGGKLSTFSFRMQNSGGSGITWYFYYSINNVDWVQISTGSCAPASYADLVDSVDRYSDDYGDEIRYRVTANYSTWYTDTYVHATIKTGWPLEVW